MEERKGAPRESPSSSEKEAPQCDLCGGPMIDLHCKLICRRCGFKRDCSDP